MSIHLTRKGRVQRGSGPKPENFGDGFFIKEIETQCLFAEVAGGEMWNIYKLDPTSIFLQASAHSILVFASNVAKILSPSKKASDRMKKRAIRLQHLLNCTDYDFSAIVNARNYLEHFDERMDRYLDSTESGGMFHRIVSDERAETATLDGWGEVKVRYLQHLNTSTLELTMVDETIYLKLVLDQAVEIGAKAKAYSDALANARE